MAQEVSMTNKKGKGVKGRVKEGSKGQVIILDGF